MSLHDSDDLMPDADREPCHDGTAKTIRRGGRSGARDERRTGWSDCQAEPGSGMRSIGEKKGGRSGEPSPAIPPKNTGAIRPFRNERAVLGESVVRRNGSRRCYHGNGRRTRTGLLPDLETTTRTFADGQADTPPHPETTRCPLP